MTIKFEAVFNDNVRPVDVQNETEKTAMIDGRRRRKDSSWRPLFDSEIEAWRYIVSSHESAVEMRERQLEQAKSALENAKRRVPRHLRELFPC